MIDYNPNIPIYLQIIDEIKRLILSEKWKTGDKIPSVRELAVTFTVNPNTMQRALSELEREGLIFTERTSGRYITTNEEVIRSIRAKQAKKSTRDFLLQMGSLGFTVGEIITFLEEEKD